MSRSILDRLMAMPPAQRQRVLDSVSEKRLQQIQERAWPVIARPEQVAPLGDNWMLWFLMGGRGGGKSRGGAEFVLDRHEQGSERLALVHKHADDMQKVIIEGPSGLLVCAERRKIHAKWTASRKRVDLRSSAGHTVCGTYYGSEPESLAGPEHDSAWADEWTAYVLERDKAGRTAIDNLRFGLRAKNPRLGKPRAVLTSTPRPLEIVRTLVAKPDVVVTHVTMFDNVRNLDPGFVQSILDSYQGTRLERQEIYGEVMGAEAVYFSRADAALLDEAPALPLLVRYWDLAHARASVQNPDPDWTAGVKVGGDTARDVVLDVRRMRGNDLDVEALMIDTAKTDGPGVRQIMEQTPGAGKTVAAQLIRAFQRAGLRLDADPVKGRKEERADLPSRRWQKGALQIVRAAWTDVFLDECEAFPDPAVHDDQVDAMSGAVHWLDKQRGRAVTGSRRSADRKVAAKAPWAL